MRISDWSSDVCSSDLIAEAATGAPDFAPEPVLAGAFVPGAFLRPFAAMVGHDDQRLAGEIALQIAERRPYGLLRVRKLDQRVAALDVHEQQEAPATQRQDGGQVARPPFVQPAPAMIAEQADLVRSEEQPS